MKNEPQKTWRYVDGVMRVTVVDFSMWAIQSERKIVEAYGKSPMIWIVSSPWCDTRFINDPRYIPTDVESSESRAKTQRTGTSSFKICEDPRTPEQHVYYKVLSVIATRNIQRGQDIFASYGPSYIFD